MQPAAVAVPCLRLFTETLYVGSDEVRAAVIALDFDYGGGARDRAAEARARQTLEGLGAIELDCLDDAAAPPGVRVDYVLRLDGDVHALCAFSAYGVPQLEQL